eukprot:CAMPEP_0174262004 /NCGR_PEP_ID=MMETSP0439-20130205/12712_1 /TAXON_ID=0 /ORGANISM="Stereomyxa ramosa, Strain Chinc5" /LENGTH=751 /DNA_ID=CAMNT_0015346633 /DNA_START=23 /DNA_END=2278 /DNA_ORIENTATION=-
MSSINSMEQLIPVINKLQDVFNATSTERIDLPQIVVVGSQSSGKSSVLENIVGRDFLPRGSGIVTRRPLVLQLINLPASDPKGKSRKGSSIGQADDSFEEWGEFNHKPNELFYNFSDIRDEIQRETDRLTGRNKGIDDHPIGLKVYSPHVLNLTLVDLPGITKVPVGDQPQNIETLIRKMIMNFIKKPNAIILAVTASNTDLANSDALQLAQEVDPTGVRTIGVLTKLDLMDKGTDALEMLQGRVIPLRLGYVGVVNRSQEDIIKGKPIREALKSEMKFFQTNRAYRDIADRCGTTFLAKTLNRILMNHIKDCLPELKAKINKMAADSQAELRSYGDAMYEGGGEGALLLQIITNFSNNFRNAIEGKSEDVAMHELYGGARINYIFNDIYALCLNHINPVDGMSMNDIRTVIRNATGPRAALFIPEQSFELLVKRQISRLEEPSLQCVELVYDELQRIVSQLENKELKRFHCLRERVVEVVNLLLHKCRVPTKEMIQNLINIEMSYINTNHPDFVGGGGAISAVFKRMASTYGMEQQQMQQQQMQQMQQQQQQMQQMQQQAVEPKKHSRPTQPLPPQPQQQSGGTGFYNMFFNQNNSMGPPQQNAMVSQQARSQQRMNKQAMRMQSAPPSGNLQGFSKLEQVPATIKAVSTPSDKERFETELIQSLLVSYFDIVRKNVQDAVPKTIMHFLVNSAKGKMQNELVAHLYKEEQFEKLLEESPEIAQRRKACKQMLDVLRRAQAILNEVRDISV